jgi:spore maturation protein SpmA
MLLAVLLGGWTGCLNTVINDGFKMAEKAVMDIALPLSAIMTIWLGIMRLADKAGLVGLLARLLRPILKRLFPDVPADHPAMGSIVMNVSANMLGLGNAATPLGLRAMAELQKLNRFPGTATNAMCTFLAINTASVQLIPATAVAILVTNGSKNPTAIIGSALMATLCSQIVGLTAVKLFQRLPLFRIREEESTASDSAQPTAKPEAKAETPLRPIPAWGWGILALFLAFFGLIFLFNTFPEIAKSLNNTLPWLHAPVAQGDTNSANVLIRGVQALSILAIPFFLSFFPLYAAVRGIKVYEEFIEGAKEGFGVAVRIIPYLVAILAAMSMFRAAHGIEILSNLLKPLLDACGFPTELLSLAFMRPLSGTGSIALFTDIVHTYGPDSLVSRMAGTLLGCTETTFYVLAVYFGSVGIRRTRHAVAAGLLADATGILASVVICKWLFS